MNHARISKIHVNKKHHPLTNLLITQLLGIDLNIAFHDRKSRRLRPRRVDVAESRVIRLSDSGTRMRPSKLHVEERRRKRLLPIELSEDKADQKTS
jgi:hypothetical protein